MGKWHIADLIEEVLLIIIAILVVILVVVSSASAEKTRASVNYAYTIAFTSSTPGDGCP